MTRNNNNVPSARFSVFSAFWNWYMLDICCFWWLLMCVFVCLVFVRHKMKNQRSVWMAQELWSGKNSFGVAEQFQNWSQQRKEVWSLQGAILPTMTREIKSLDMIGFCILNEIMDWLFLCTLHLTPIRSIGWLFLCCCWVGGTRFFCCRGTLCALA